MIGLDDLPLRDDLSGRSAYGAPQIDVPIRLNTNENPWPPSDALVADLVTEVGAAARVLNRYPDREAVALRTDLAAYLSRAVGIELDVSQLWAANGSNEILQQLLQAFGGPGRVALGFEPSYTMHRLISVATATRWESRHRNDDYSLDAGLVSNAIAEQAPDVVFLCSPNNPTGTALSLDVVAAACESGASASRRLGRLPAMVVVDEAYAEFARPGTPSALTLLADHPNLVVTRTMSKAFAMAGARVGYMAANPAVVEAMHLVRLPYHLSALTQAAARVGLAHVDELLATVEAVTEQRDRIVAALPDLGLTSVPSDANFTLFGVFPDSTKAWDALLERGVLVRDVGIAGWLRVTAGLPEETDAFLSALADLTPLLRT